MHSRDTEQQRKGKGGGHGEYLSVQALFCSLRTRLEKKFTAEKKISHSSLRPICARGALPTPKAPSRGPSQAAAGGRGVDRRGGTDFLFGWTGGSAALAF